jgi:uncharacterized protein YndB with AHSA1/START domain
MKEPSMKDIIERQITVQANPERVYDAITNPDKITEWFPDKVQGNLAVGEQAIFNFTEAKHQTRIFVEAARPHEYFAYRWVPGGSSGLVHDVLSVPNTLVEFFIEQVATGTKVTLKESGFAKLPAEVAEASFNDNTGGWEIMMGRLEKVMTQA